MNSGLRLGLGGRFGLMSKGHVLKRTDDLTHKRNGHLNLYL